MIHHLPLLFSFVIVLVYKPSISHPLTLYRFFFNSHIYFLIGAILIDLFMTRCPAIEEIRKSKKNQLYESRTKGLLY